MIYEYWFTSGWRPGDPLGSDPHWPWRFETDPTLIDTPDAPDDDVPEPDNDVVPETDPNAETAAGTEPA